MNFQNMMPKEVNETTILLVECAAMLEKYVNRFPAERGCAKFSDEDMAKWNNIFYPKLVKTGILLDDKFFSVQGMYAGIGTDGYFNGYDFFHFLYRNYKALYEFSKLKG